MKCKEKKDKKNEKNNAWIVSYFFLICHNLMIDILFVYQVKTEAAVKVAYLSQVVEIVEIAEIENVVVYVKMRYWYVFVEQKH